VASPVVATIVANDGFDEAHVYAAGDVLVELSLYVPVAVNCTVLPMPTVAKRASRR